MPISAVSVNHQTLAIGLHLRAGSGLRCESRSCEEMPVAVPCRRRAEFHAGFYRITQAQLLASTAPCGAVLGRQDLERQKAQVQTPRGQLPLRTRAHRDTLDQMTRADERRCKHGPNAIQGPFVALYTHPITHGRKACCLWPISTGANPTALELGHPGSALDFYSPRSGFVEKP